MTRFRLEHRWFPLFVAALLAVALIAFFGLFFFWPIGGVLRQAFVDSDGKPTLAFVAEVFRNRIYLEGLLNAFWIAMGSTAATAVLAAPLAWVGSRFRFPGKTVLASLLLVPMILPPFVGAIGIRQMLGQYGALNTVLVHLGILGANDTIDWLGSHRMLGIMALNALHLYPILMLNLAAALANIDPAMEEAAENLGCTGWRKFFRVTLPLLMPGLFAGGSIVFIFAFTELGVPLIFDFDRVTSVQIFNGIKEIAGNPFPFALVSVMLVITVALYALSRWAFGRDAGAMVSKATTLRMEVEPSRQVRWLCTGLFSMVVAAALLPHVGVILTSVAGFWYRSVLPSVWTGEHYRIALGHALTVPSILNSLQYASLSTVIDLVLGLGIAYVVVRTRLPGRWLLDAASMLPLAVPGLVLAFGYVSLTQTGPLAAMNPARDPFLLLVIAYAIRRLPYVVRSATAGLQQTSVTLEEAAQNLGAGPLRVLQRVTVPLLLPNLIGGGLLAFSFAMLEVSDSLVLAQKQQHFPITRAIYELYLLLGEGRFLAAALGVWAMVFLGVSLVLANRLLGKKLGAAFRA